MRISGKRLLTIGVFLIVANYGLGALLMPNSEDDPTASEGNQPAAISSQPVTVMGFSTEASYDEALSKAKELCSDSSFRSYEDNFICELKPYDEFRAMRIHGDRDGINKMDFTSHILNSADVDSENWKRKVAEELGVKEFRKRTSGGVFGYTESDTKIIVGEENGLMIIPGMSSEKELLDY